MRLRFLFVVVLGAGLAAGAIHLASVARAGIELAKPRGTPLTVGHDDELVFRLRFADRDVQAAIDGRQVAGRRRGDLVYLRPGRLPAGPHVATVSARTPGPLAQTVAERVRFLLEERPDASAPRVRLRLSPVWRSPSRLLAVRIRDASAVRLALRIDGRRVATSPPAAKPKRILRTGPLRSAGTGSSCAPSTPPATHARCAAGSPSCRPSASCGAGRGRRAPRTAGACTPGSGCQRGGSTTSPGTRCAIACRTRPTAAGAPTAWSAPFSTCSARIAALIRARRGWESATWSPPGGGPFTSGGHLSHQNGLDVDVYYPRRDRRLRAPTSLEQVDRALAQDLVKRFVAASAQYVFVDAQLGFDGPPGVVQHWPNHEDHLHVRLTGD